MCIYEYTSIYKKYIRIADIWQKVRKWLRSGGFSEQGAKPSTAHVGPSDELASDSGVDLCLRTYAAVKGSQHPPVSSEVVKWSKGEKRRAILTWYKTSWGKPIEKRKIQALHVQLKWRANVVVHSTAKLTHFSTEFLQKLFLSFHFVTLIAVKQVILLSSTDTKTQQKKPLMHVSMAAWDGTAVTTPRICKMAPSTLTQWPSTTRGLTCACSNAPLCIPTTSLKPASTNPSF